MLSDSNTHYRDTTRIGRDLSSAIVYDIRAARTPISRRRAGLLEGRHLTARRHRQEARGCERHLPHATAAGERPGLAARRWARLPLLVVVIVVVVIVVVVVVVFLF